MVKPKSSGSQTKKTESDKAGEKKKAAAPPKAKSSAKEKSAPPATAEPAAPAVASSPTIAGPGSDAVMDRPSTGAAKGPRFASKPPRNPFVGTKNPRLRDRDR